MPDVLSYGLCFGLGDNHVAEALMRFRDRTNSCSNNIREESI
jgi:hypothetical protein